MRFLLFLVTLFVISFHSEKTDAMNIQCEFKSKNFGFEFKNGCDVQSFTLSSSGDREITSVNGDIAKTYNDVLWFYSRSNNFNNFPKNIKKFFPNVEVVYIGTANITTLTKSDMASLGPQLRTFSFYGNKLEVLEEGLFDENPNLDDISFSRNNIKFVASEVFDNLPKLTSLHFIDNPCHSGYVVWDDRIAVLTLIKNIEEKCQDLQAYEKFKNLIPTPTNFKELEAKIEVKFDTTNKKIDTTKDMIIKATDTKLDSTLVKPMNSLQDKINIKNHKLDTSDKKWDDGTRSVIRQKFPVLKNFTGI